VDDWNSRCHNSQFLHTDGIKIDEELSQSESRIQAEVEQTLREWTPAPVFVPAPPSLPADTGAPADGPTNPTWQPAPTDPDDPAVDEGNSEQ